MEIFLNPDRELSEDVLALGLLVQGRTTIDDFRLTDRSLTFAELLKEFGLRVEEKGSNTILEGVGFSYKVPTLLKIPESENAAALMLALASRETETIYTATASPKILARTKKFLTAVFDAVIESEDDQTLTFHFSEILPPLRENREGYISYLAKNAVLLNGLVRGRSVECEEKSPVRSEFVEMLGYFGAQIQMQTTGMQEMSELERRMAKARGVRTERRVRTSLQETKILTSRDYFVPGDPTEAAALSILAIVSPEYKGKKIAFKNILVETDRSGAFSALKRMGAHIDFGSRHERYGTAYADVLVSYEKRLVSRRLGEDILCTCLEEYPFLALAACSAEGESILRIPDSLSKELRPRCEFLAQNLKRTGASIGVYEEGLVIRGREGLDAGTFDAADDPILSLLFTILSKFSQGETRIENESDFEIAFPGILENLGKMSEAES